MLTVQGTPWNTTCAVCPLDLFIAVAQDGLIQNPLHSSEHFEHVLK